MNDRVADGVILRVWLPYAGIHHLPPRRAIELAIALGITQASGTLNGSNQRIRLYSAMFDAHSRPRYRLDQIEEAIGAAEAAIGRRI